MNDAVQIQQQVLPLYQAKRFSQGLEILRANLKNHKNNPHYQNTIGLFYAALNQHDKAINSFKFSLKKLPNDPLILANYAKSLEQSGKESLAIKAYEKSLQFEANNPAALTNLSVLLIKANKLDKVEGYLKKAIELNPSEAITYNTLGLLYEEVFNYPAAIEAFQQAIRINGSLANLHHHLSEVLSKNNQDSEAIIAAQKAIELDENFAEAHKSLGRRYVESGQLDLAETHLRKALSLDFLADAFFYLSSLDVVDIDDPLLSQAKIKFETADSAQQESIGFGLGKILDKHSQYEEAFKYMSAANKIKRKRITFNKKAREKYFSSVMDHIDAKLYDELHTSLSGFPTPIFVLGMPRSGTTLVEQILAKHDHIQFGGELAYLEDLIKEHLPRYLNGDMSLDRKALNTIRREYLEKIAAISNGHQFVTDKMPMNFEFIGLIRILFPDAKIIHVKRHPLDTCLSCFMQSFGSDLPYIYDLEETGFYFTKYTQLMDHWQKQFGPDIYTISYEKLVSNLEHETRSLLDFCKLDFNPDCLLFYKQERVVKTASFVQVRQPIYNKSINRWQNYADQIQPLIAVLKQNNITINP